MDKVRRKLLVQSLTVTSALICKNSLGVPELLTAKSRVIKIQAKKFAYTPNQITIKKGEQTTLELTSVDFIHGFTIPDFKIRTDLQPGQITKVQFNPDKIGRYSFFCDNFCGTGHEEMNGTITVVD